MLKSMLEELINKIFLSRNNTLREGLNVFANTNVNVLPVINDEGRYLGVVRLQQLIRADKLQEEKIGDYLINYPAFKISEISLKEECYANYEILPVIDEEEILQGFITREKLISRICENHQKKSSQFMEVINSSYNGIVAIDKRGKIFVFNPAAERILSYKQEQVYSKHISYLDPIMGLLETMETGKPSIGKKTVVNGFNIVTNRTPLLYQGKCVGAVAVFIDISDLEKVNRELDFNKNLLQELNAIFESSYDGFYIVDKEAIVIRVNSAWEKICGFSREYVIGKNARELVDAGCYNNSAALVTLEKKEVSTVLLNITSGPKKGQRVIATGTPVFDDSGDISQVVVNVRDITALENLKDQLEETKELSKRYEKELEEIRLQQFKTKDLIAQSPEMLKVLELVVRVSQVDSTVIVTGESGVGKEVITEKIHLSSKRKQKSLIKINCGAIPENLLESELFGYDGGAFTGAKKDGKPGMFELASGGTLLLDEIGDLPLNLQVKLLRVLQEKEIVRVGGIKAIKVDTRIIAATNKDLVLMVKEGTFREDLFYRLNVVNIKIPPLRKRQEDLPPLINKILEKLNARYGKNKSLSQPVVEKFLKHDWPGNIRELENTLERLVVLVKNDLIEPRHLPDHLQDNTDLSINSAITLNAIVPLKLAVEEIEYQILQKAAREYKTTRKIAKVLEVNQSTVVRKMQQYNIGKNDVREHQDDAYWHRLRI